MKAQKTQTLFLDIGGVLLTNGWDSTARDRSIEKFGIDKDEMEQRHGLVFDTYELGKLTLDDYLQYVLFYKKQKFSPEDFKNFIFQQSQPLPGALDYFKELKSKNGLKVVALSNEPREINDYRIEKYKLKELFDFFVSSSYVNMRKPDPAIYKLALDTAQTPVQNTLYVDDRLMYIEMAVQLGMPSLHYQGIDTAKAYFKEHAV